MIKSIIKKKNTVIVILLVLIVMSTAGCAEKMKTPEKLAPEESATRTIIDMSGREVIIPKEIKKIYSAVPIGTVLVYTIDPNKLAAKNFKLSEAEKKYTVKEYHDLPVLGNYIMEYSASEEQILKIDPDIILYTGMINDSWKKKVEIAQEKLGKPVIMVDGSLKNIQKAYEFLGNLLGEEKRAQELSAYCANVLKEAKKITDKIPEDKKSKVYYAVGEKGLRTYSAKTIHSEVIDIAGGVNVVDVKGEAGYPLVSTEQLLSWNPDIIIANKLEARGGKDGTALRTQILENKILAKIKAVKEKEVYEVPCAPFNWFGQPPSVARILGIKWLGNLLYPEEYNCDIKEEAKAFYEKFYHIKITDADLDELMVNALSHK